MKKTGTKLVVTVGLVLMACGFGVAARAEPRPDLAKVD
jgi:hypothetical protein